MDGTIELDGAALPLWGNLRDVEDFFLSADLFEEGEDFPRWDGEDGE